MTGLAAKLWPYFSYLAYIQLVLLGLALIVGAVLIIRRKITQTPLEGDPAYTRERVAMELTAEIERLRDLRNRIVPELKETSSAEPQPAVVAPAPAAAAAPAAPMTEDERKKIQAELEAQFSARIAELEKQNEELAKASAAQGASVAPPDGESPSEEVSTLKAKVEGLEKTLLEYQIFENDIALVKKYKTENEELRKQLSATPQVTEEDIADLFTAMSVPGGGAPGETPPEPAAAPAVPEAPAAFSPEEQISEPVPTPTPAEPVVEAAPAPTPAPVPEATPVPVEAVAPVAQESAPVETPAPSEEALPSLEDLLKEAETPPAADLAEKGEKFETEAVKTEPAVEVATSLSEEDAEALAHTDNNSDDQLMAEFQKILGGDK